MTEQASLERMRPADSILWRMEEDPVLRSTVTVVALLDRAPEFGRLRRSLLAASARLPHLRQVVAEPPFGLGSPAWAQERDFDIDYHLRRVSLPGASFEELLFFAAREAMGGFDRRRPLWEYTVVDKVGEGAALVQKFHHATTDGLGAVRLALELFDAERTGARRLATRRETAAIPLAPRPLRQAGAAGQLLGGVGAAAGRRARWALRVPTLLAGAALAAGRDPLRAGGELASSLLWTARLLAPVTAPLSPVMRARSPNLSFAAFDVDLERLHSAARAAGGSINDAFVAAVLAGLRRYHGAHGAAVPELRMTLPVSTRRPADPLGSNRFVPVRFPVPLGAGDPAASLRAVSSLVRAWREGPALGLSDGLATIINALPTPAVAGLFGLLLRNVDFVATDVPGLTRPVYLAGAELTRQYAFAPPSGAALNVSLLSHVGHGCVGVNMDKAAVTDPGRLVSSLKEGFGEVLALAPAAPPRRAVAGS